MTPYETVIAGKNIRCAIDPLHGGRLSSLQAFGRELLVTKKTETNLQKWGSYPMVPFAGRVRNGSFNYGSQTFQLELNMPPHAIHGTILDRKVEVIDATPTSIAMKVDLGDRFPFKGSVSQSISINDDTIEFVLTLSTEAESMPGQVGWHPWFARPCRVETNFGAMYLRDSAGMPTGKTITPPQGPYDDCFTNSRQSPKIIFSSDREISLVIESDCSHWVIYDEPEHAICVEPQSGPPDGFNLEPKIITPGSPLTRYMRFIISN